MAKSYSGPELDTIRKNLVDLVTEGLSAYSVTEKGGALLQLKIIASRVQLAADADEDEQEQAYLDAVIAVLKIAVTKKYISSRKHRRLLKHVLPLKDEYMGTAIEHRRIAAGQNLTDGKKVVAPGTIRTYYEPKAITELTEGLIAMETTYGNEPAQ